MKTIHHSPEGARPSGPYTPAVEISLGGSRLLFVSGQGTKDPQTGERVLGDIALQARAALDNLLIVVEGSGFALSTIVKVTLYLKDMADYSAVNEVYADYFPAGACPARSTVAVAGLPGGQGIEIDAIAAKEETPVR